MQKIHRPIGYFKNIVSEYIWETEISEQAQEIKTKQCQHKVVIKAVK